MENRRVGLEVAVVADVDAAGVGGQIPRADEEDCNAGESPEEELHGKRGHEGLMGSAAFAGGPGEEESAHEADAGGEGDAEKRCDEAIFEARTGHEECTDRDPVKRQEAEEE